MSLLGIVCFNYKLSLVSGHEAHDTLHYVFIALTRGSASVGEDDIISIWRECSNDLKDCLGSVVVPIGSLSVGLCRHRAILFKVSPYSNW